MSQEPREPHPPINPVNPEEPLPPTAIEELFYGATADEAAMASVIERGPEAVDDLRTFIEAAEQGATNNPSLLHGLNAARLLLVKALFDSAQRYSAIEDSEGVRQQHRQAFEIIEGISPEAPWSAAEVRVEAIHLKSGNTWDALLDISIGYGNRESLLDTLSALRNYCIERGDEEMDDFEIADHISRVFELRGIEADPEEGWADMLTRQYSDLNKQELLVSLRDDSMWRGVPIRRRQHIIASWTKQRYLMESPMANRVLPSELTDWLIDQRQKYPRAKWLENVTSLTALVVAAEADEESTLALALSIEKRSELFTELAAGLVQEGHEDLAERLALKASDYGIGAAIFLDSPWQDADARLAKFGNVINGEGAPIAQRLGFAKIVRDRAIAEGNEPLGDHYASVVRRLEDAQRRQEG